jgi:hypothetical protein
MSGGQTAPMTETPQQPTPDDDPPAKTAAEEDHSDPSVFVGEDADPPTDED